MESYTTGITIRTVFLQSSCVMNFLFGMIGGGTTITGIAKGLIYGPAEFDECLYQQHWFSISAWAWRGLLSLQRFLDDTAVLAVRPCCIEQFTALLPNTVSCDGISRDLLIRLKCAQSASSYY
jgi:hypothetical protein